MPDEYKFILRHNENNPRPLRFFIEGFIDRLPFDAAKMISRDHLLADLLCWTANCVTVEASMSGKKIEQIEIRYKLS